MLRITTIIFYLLLSLSAIGQDFDVYPTHIKFNAEPGETQNQLITILNHSSLPQRYTCTLADYKLDKEKSNELKTVAKNKFSCTKWISIDSTQFELKPNQSIQLSLSLTVPDNATETRWCLLKIKQVKEQSGFDADKEISAAEENGNETIDIIQTPQSNKEYNVRLSHLKEITKSEEENNSFETLIKNTGTNIVEGNVSLTVVNLQSKKEQKYRPTDIILYPGEVQTVKLALPEKLGKGKYAIAAVLDIGHDHPLFGTHRKLDIK